MSLRELASSAVAGLPGEVVAAIRIDAAAGAALLDLTVEQLDEVPRRGTGGWCDGASFVDEGRIMYRPTLGRRENFTICHEIAHHILREHNDEAIDWVYDRKDPARTLEDLCDRVAASLLISDTVATAEIDDHGVTAQTVVALFEETNASRHCCANRLIDSVRGKGFVAIVDPETMEVWATAKKPDTSPASFRGQRVPAGHPLHRLRETENHIRLKAWWPLGPSDRWDYYLDAIRHDRWIIAVLAETDLWGIDQLHFAQEERQGYDGQMTCPCGFSGDTPWYPCNECETPLCAKCRKCQCDWRAERESWEMCMGCTVSVRSHLLVDGICDQCR